MFQYPRALPNDVKIVKCLYAQQAEKILIIASSYTVIKKFAVVVEILAASIASKAMVAVALNIAVTQNTESYII